MLHPSNVDKYLSFSDILSSPEVNSSHKQTEMESSPAKYHSPRVWAQGWDLRTGFPPTNWDVGYNCVHTKLTSEHFIHICYGRPNSLAVL